MVDGGEFAGDAALVDFDEDHLAALGRDAVLRSVPSRTKKTSVACSWSLATSACFS